MNIKDCKCGAKYVRGLPAIDNGQILIGEQYVCTECWNRDIEQNLVKLAKHASALLAKMGLNREEIAVELARYYSRITGLVCRCRLDESKRKYVVRRMGSVEFTVTPKAAREIVERPPSKQGNNAAE